MRPLCHPHGHFFDIFFISAKTNDIIFFIVKVSKGASCTENCVDLHIRYYFFKKIVCPLNILK